MNLDLRDRRQLFKFDIFVKNFAMMNENRKYENFTFLRILANIFLYAGIVVSGISLVLLFLSITPKDVMIGISSIIGGLVLSAFGELIKVFLNIEKNTRI